jgi:hypothetical protein
VKNVIGNDKIVRMGFTMVFKNAKTTATKKAVINLLISGESTLKNWLFPITTPSKKYAVIKTANVEIKSFAKKFIID